MDLAQFRADSAARLARLQRTDTLKGLFVNRYLSMFQQLGGDALRRRALEAMGEVRIFDFWNYPYARMVQVGLTVVDELAPRLGGVDSCLREFGRLATTSYLGSVLGRAFLATFHPSPRTMLIGMPWAIGTVFTFGERTVVFPEPGRCTFRCRREFSPAPSNAAAVQAAVEASGGHEVRVSITSLDLFNYDLNVSWRE
ncbi:MAG: TIGR02265 family protein [Myxococcales bacterium]|nr:TIGR02265 family protein [Myxococcales bacterium]